MTPEDEATINAVGEMYAAAPHPISPDALRLACLQYEPITDRWYYRLPDIMRAGMEHQGYDADEFFAKASADWGDPNDR